MKPKRRSSLTAANASDGMTAIYQRSFEDPRLAREFITTTLFPAEVMILVKYHSEIAGKRMLEIGCGAGRVTRYLARWTPHLVAIDFSAMMIDICKRAFSHLPLFVCDARDLSQFADGSFDVTVFSFNGIDSLTHDGRLTVLAEIHRVLPPGGLVIFSSHNRRYRHARAGPRLEVTRNPFTVAKRLVQFGRATMNRRKRRSLEREEAEYAIINDNAHDYSILHYYLSREAQAKQFARAGFEMLETYGEDGAILGHGDDDSANGTLYYVARRI